MSKLIPPDPDRCQAEVHSRAPFMQMGGPPVKITRCTYAPIVIARETKIPHGEMSLCDACLKVALKQLGSDYFTLRRVQ